MDMLNRAGGVFGSDDKGQQKFEKQEVVAWSGAQVDQALPYFAAHLKGEKGHYAQVGGQAVFNYAVICAMYDCINTGERQVVVRADFE